MSDTLVARASKLIPAESLVSLMGMQSGTLITLAAAGLFGAPHCTVENSTDLVDRLDLMHHCCMALAGEA